MLSPVSGLIIDAASPIRAACAVNRPLAETRAIVDEHRLDHLRIHDESVLQPEIAIDDYWLVVKVLAPTAQGVLDHLEHEPKKAEPAAWRYRQQRNGRVQA